MLVYAAIGDWHLEYFPRERGIDSAVWPSTRFRARLGFAPFDNFPGSVYLNYPSLIASLDRPSPTITAVANTHAREN